MKTVIPIKILFGDVLDVRPLRMLPGNLELDNPILNRRMAGRTDDRTTEELRVIEYPFRVYNPFSYLVPEWDSPFIYDV
jgi:hypothetical protein